MAIGLALLLGAGSIAAASSFPSGFGFGAGYGAGVRAGYDIVYPKIAPYVKEIIDFLIPGGALSPSGDRPEIVSDPQADFSKKTQMLPGIVERAITPGEKFTAGRHGVPGAKGIISETSEDQLLLQQKSLALDLHRKWKTLKSVTSPRGKLRAQKSFDLSQKNMIRFLENNPQLRR